MKSEFNSADCHCEEKPREQGQAQALTGIFGKRERRMILLSMGAVVAR